MPEDKSKSKNREILLNLAVESMGSPGIVVDADVATRSACRCYTYEGEPKLCYSKGVIGTLSKAQREAYCKPLVELGESKRLRAFMEAKEEAQKEIAGIPRGERLEPWLRAMSKSLRKRGIEV